MIPALDKVKRSLFSLKDKGAFSILVGTFLTKIAAFLGSIILVRIMSKPEYGTLSYIENLYTYAYLFAGYGLNNAVFRYLVLQETEAGRKGIFSYVISRGTWFNVAFASVIALVSIFFPHASEFSAASIMLPLMLLALPFQFLTDTCSYSLRALFLNRAYAVVAVVTVALVWASKAFGASFFGLEGAVAAWPVAYGAMALFLLAYFKRNVFEKTKSELPPKSERKAIRSYSLQYMVTNGLWALFLQNDLLMIGLITGDPSYVANYKVAYALPAAIAILSSSIGMFVAPYFVKHEKDGAWVWASYKKTMVASVVLVGGAALAIGLFASPIITLFYGESYLDIVPLMNMLLVAGFITNGLRYTTANLLAAMGEIRVNMVVSLCGVAAQVVLNFLFIPRFGPYGAAYTGIIVYSIMALVIFISFLRLHRPRKK